jgi:N utilization substance protein A
MEINTDFIDALNQIEKEKGIDKETIFEAIETSLVTACKKNFGAAQNFRVTIDRKTGTIDVFAKKDVVEAVTDAAAEISVDDARDVNSQFQVGDVFETPIAPKDFGRIAAQTARQVVIQKFREAERSNIYKEFKHKEREIVTGVIQRRDRRNIIIGIGRNELVLEQSEQVPGEEYRNNQRLKVFVLEVKDAPRGPVIKVSRTHPDFVRRLFEQEVPEVYDGLVEIKAVSREAGSRTKIAVHTNLPEIDAIGSCVGEGGQRVGFIVDELRGEKVDIILWDEDPRFFIASALSPSDVLAVVAIPEERTARIVVPDNQLSLAIGKEGQNARLAARLTGYKIDIRSESQARETDFVSEEDYYDFAYYEDDEYGEERELEFAAVDE